MKLNFLYFDGQVFNLDQATMNKMIEDVHALRADLFETQALLTEACRDNWEVEMSQALEIRKLSAELAEYKSLHAQTVALVMPGEVDSGDAYMKILRDLRAELEQARLEKERAYERAYERAAKECDESPLMYGHALAREIRALAAVGGER
jgi:hypothetical protein